MKINKMIINCVLLSFLFSLLQIQIPAEAAVENQPQNFYNSATGAYYNLIDKFNGTNGSNKFSNSNVTATLDANGVISATGTSATSAPSMTYYYGSTPQSNFNYISVKYKFTGDDTTSSFIITNVDNKSITVSTVLKGDGNWRTAVYDISTFSASISSNVKYYAFKYTQTASTYTTKFEFKEIQIFKIKPLISNLNLNITPKLGAYPMSAGDVILLNDQNYTVSNIAWKEDGADFSGKFSAGHTYKADITMKANDYYAFTDSLSVSADESLSGSLVTIENYLYGNTVTCEVIYELQSAKIVSTLPADNDIDVKVDDTTVDVKFDKDIDDSTMSSQNITISPATTFTIKKVDARNYSIVFSEELKLNTKYSVAFLSSIMSQSALSLEGKTISFTTVKSYPLPVITSSTPNDGATNISCSDLNVDIIFNVNMNQSTLIKKNISVSPQANFDIALSESNLKECVIKFSDSLKPSTKYTITLNNSILSYQDAALTGASISFTTVASIDNLTPEGDMESVDPGYKFYNGGSATLTYVTETELTGSNNRVLKILNGKQDDYTVFYLQGSAVMDASHTYYYKFNVKADKIVNIWSPVLSRSLGMVSTTWQTFSGTVTNVTDLAGFGAGNPACTLYFDNIEIYDLTTAPQLNPKLYNPKPDSTIKDVSPINYKLDVTFDMPMDINTMTTSNITCTSSKISSIVPVGLGLKKFTINFNRLDANTAYTINFSNAVKSILGTALTSSNINVSTLTVATSTPVITSVIPVNNSNNVQLVDLEMNIEFDTYMDTSTMNTVNITADSDIIKQIITYSDNMKKCTIVFDDDKLLYDHTYTISLSSSIVSLTNHGITATNFAFTTKSISYILSNANLAKNGASIIEMKNFFEKDYNDLRHICELYDLLVSKKSPLLELFYEQMAKGAVVSTIDDLYKQESETALLTIAQNSTDSSEIDALIKSKDANLTNTGSYKTYNEILNIDGKNFICNKILGKDSFSSTTTFQNYFTEQVNLKALYDANGWETVKQVLVINQDAFTGSFKISSLLNKIDSLEKPSKVYNQLQNLNTSSLGGVYQALQVAYDKEKTSENSSSINSPSSGGGGSYSIQTYNTVNQPTNGVKTEVKGKYDDLDTVEWAKDSVESLSESGILSGKSDRIFSPNDFVTREEFVKMLVIASDVYDKTANVDFSDVTNDSWYYYYVASAVNKGIIQGINKTNFGSGMNITREDMATIIYRAADKIGYTFANNGIISFADEVSISDYSKKAISLLQSTGIINGTGNNEFSPKKCSTRAEAAVIVNRFIKLIKTK